LGVEQGWDARCERGGEENVLNVETATRRMEHDVPIELEAEENVERARE